MIRIVQTLLCLTAALTLTACVAPPVASRATPAIAAIAANDSMNGDWEGILGFQRPNPGGNLAYRVSITPTEVKIFERNGVTGVWAEMMPGHFQMSRMGSNTIIQGTHSGGDEDGTWVETWVLVTTSKTIDELQVDFVRLVNNVDLPVSNGGKIFSEHATGSFKRWQGGQK
jgi:hypothetical protein